MAKLEFNKPVKKKHESESDEDLYEQIVSSTETVFEDDITEDEAVDEDDELGDTTEIEAKILGPKLSKALREEIKKPEFARDYLLFKYRGETLEGIPMKELNPGKFIFNIDGKLRGINLIEAIIL